MTDIFDQIDSDKARLEINARSYRYDPVLDPIADRIEAGEAVADVPARVLDHASIHKDFRDQYRRAVAAGAIRDDRTAPTDEEN